MARSTYRTGQAGQTTGPRALVTPRQMAALDKMAAGNGFTDGSALLCDLASTDLASLGRMSRPVVQMFVDRAFGLYGRTSRPPRTRGRCEDAPCCGCCA